jgi:head-tail adaptor
MRNGHCSIPVTVERASTTRDDYGHQTRTWSSHIDPLWVSMRRGSSMTTSAEGETQVDSVTFTTPWYPSFDITRADRITHDGDAYEIRSIADRDGRRAFYELVAVRVDL